MAPPGNRNSAIWRVLLWLPIRRSHQALFAEAFAEAVTAGAAATKAIGLAAKVNPSWRFRHALAQMRQDVASGYGLEVSLRRSEARVARHLLAALRVGEEHGKLAEELFAFARTTSPLVSRRLRRAVGRRPEATRYAAALARLLRDESLTLEVVAAAGSVAAGGSRRFQRVVDGIVEEMRSGSDFAEALTRYPRHFDALYCGLLQTAESRSQLRRCLERLGKDD